MDAIRANKNCLSGLAKYCGEASVDVALVRLLRELFELTLSTVTVDQLTSVAIQIRKNFWMLRFEEVTFALNKGINQGYGKIYGTISYPQISSWLDEYKETDRAQAISERADSRKGSVISKEDVPDELLYLNAKYTGVKLEKELTPEEKLKNLDDQQWGYFIQNRNTISLKELEDLLIKTKNLPKLNEAIQTEIKKRSQ